MAKGTVISLSGHGFPTLHARRVRAANYLAAAIELKDLAGLTGRTPAWPYVRLFLRGRSFELALKAHLLANGWSEADVKRKLGHRLERALAAVLKDGLSVRQPSAKVLQELKAFDPLYADKRFEYFSLLELFVPSAAQYGRLWRYADVVTASILRSFPKP